ncbi:polysaccharide deacetylase family protein [Patescibacteria group bacterium]|nr:polysaccharide deacetylase family protein [Patescibacteria group bacterium]MBU0777229.1 polysaccharide deacetylase family protein [Patescibacteria group bacterium]MBU0845924.1 polysaccharide deacetylase family protein [Patescibacteria group bacterium]MBU0922952.1 polysaccharide deacetylase family protein [Patescibacteria group bacterium]MBU1066198.1 polysaccharide deacetylase family protein [Patescibacteria group bacterium]
MSKAEFIVCVDDGHPLDLKVAEIFLKKGIRAIFYIPLKNSEGLPTLGKKEIRYLSSNFEIGGHTYNHIDLTSVPLDIARKEIVSGKEELEDIIGKKIVTFCPPRGKFKKEILKIAKETGFKDFRGVRRIDFKKADRNKFLWYPNLHIYPHSQLKDILECVKSGDFYSLAKRFKYIKTDHLGLIDVFKRGNVPFYIWLHSWELEKFKLWRLIENL